MTSYLISTGPDESGIVTLKLNRPEKKNALSIAMRDEITAALASIASNPAAKVVVVTGQGNTFCSGFDLDEFKISEPEFVCRLWESSDRFHHTFLNFPLPIIAAVNGPAIGAGFDVAVMCDIRIAGPNARFAHPEHAFIEVVYGPLQELVGGAIARDLVLTGRPVEAEEALQLHLVTRLVTGEKLLEEACNVARQIAKAPREILVRQKAKIIKRAMIPDVATLEL